MSEYKLYPEKVDRLDIICGCPINPTIHPCEKCNSEDCYGKNECVGCGAYTFGLRIGKK